MSTTKRVFTRTNIYDANIIDLDYTWCVCIYFLNLFKVINVSELSLGLYTVKRGRGQNPFGC